INVGFLSASENDPTAAGSGLDPFIVNGSLAGADTLTLITVGLESPLDLGILTLDPSFEQRSETDGVGNFARTAIGVDVTTTLLSFLFQDLTFGFNTMTDSGTVGTPGTTTVIDVDATVNPINLGIVSITPGVSFTQSSGPGAVDDFTRLGIGADLSVPGLFGLGDLNVSVTNDNFTGTDRTGATTNLQVGLEGISLGFLGATFDVHYGNLAVTDTLAGTSSNDTVLSLGADFGSVSVTYNVFNFATSGIPESATELQITFTQPF
ncbi:MAG: hypothetical protein HY335_07815, partial [Deinococcus sp.]|nr:hypothetical protein [Deinococcus sp.]